MRRLLTLSLSVILGLPVTVLAQTGSEPEFGQFLGARESLHPQWFKQSFLDFEEDIAEATAQNKRLILYFHQRGCPYCNKLIEDNFGNATIAGKVRKHFDLIAINMWGDREVIQVGGKLFTEKTLAQALNVNFTPTLLFFNENKKTVLRLDGYHPPADFALALDYVSGKKERQSDYANYVANLQQGKKHGKLNEAEGILSPPYDISRLLGDKPLAVLFEEPDCENCNLLHNKTFADSGADELLQRFNIIQLNRWSDSEVIKPDGTPTTARQWALQLGLAYSPAIIFFDTAGNHVLSLTAMFRTFHILSAFDYVASGVFQSQPGFQRYLSERSKHIRATGADVDIWRY